jgi:hypothetical protein
MALTLLFILGISAQFPFICSYSYGIHQIITDDFIDVTTGSEFNGLGTFAHLPYVNCLNKNDSEEGRYDIAILGAPFDTVCSSPLKPSIN